MFNKSLLNISLVSIGNVVNAGFGMVFLTAVARSLSLSDFGKYAFLTSFLVFMSKVIDFGSNSLYVTKSILTQRDLTQKFISSRIILFCIALPISYIILAAFQLFTISFVSIFTLGLVAYGINVTFFAFFQKYEKFHFAIFLNTLPSIIKVFAALLIFLHVINLDVILAVAIFSFSMLSCSVLIYFLPAKPGKLHIAFSDAVDLFLETYPAGIASVIGSGWPAITNSVAKLVKNFESVGIYSLAEKISSVFTLVSLSIFTVLLPRNARLKSAQQKINYSEIILLALGILSLSLVAMTVARIVLIYVFGDKFIASHLLLNILLLASAVSAIHAFMENYFYVAGRINYLLVISTAKLAIFLIMCLILIPQFQLVGLAYAQLLAAIVALVISALGVIRLQA